MRPLNTILGLLLFAAGTIIIVYAIYFAILDFSAIYGNALNSPLDDPRAADGAVGEKAIGDAMLRHVIIGAIGVPPLIIGSAMMTMSTIRRRRQAKRMLAR